MRMNRKHRAIALALLIGLLAPLCALQADAQVSLLKRHTDKLGNTRIDYYATGHDYFTQGRYDMAQSYLKVALSRGDLKAGEDLGYIYYWRGDRVTAEAYAKPSAQAGFPTAMGLYGMLISNDRPTEGFDYIKRGADAGDAYSFYYLAQCYAQGVGTAKDLNQALYWAKLADEAGIREAKDYYANLLASTPTQQTRGLKRLALVVGNSRYNDPTPPLANPANDANAIAAELESLGFTVVKSVDATHRQLDQAITRFGQQARDYDVAMFFYSGHGLQHDGMNYLVPVDADIPTESHIAYECTNANLVLDLLDKSGCKMKIMVLDACRNNPFARSWTRGVGNQGLTMMNAPVGTFIAYSTAPGDVASDGDPAEKNSPYTKALLEVLRMPGLSITDVFQEVLEKVSDRTNGKQNPWTSNSFRGKFYFNDK